MAGDIAEAQSVVTHLRNMESLLSIPIYFVLGNHDFYGGSIRSVRERIRQWARGSPLVKWLVDEGVVSLTPKTGLIGHDSWGDGRLGNYEGSTLEMNDFHLIEELRDLGKRERLRWLNRLADEAAEHFRRELPRALESHQRIILLTHVPPFQEAVWHRGRISSEDFLPFFGCKSVGETLLEIMRSHPDRHLLVLCGHTHGGGQMEMLPNLSVVTGAAVYGKPTIQAVLEVE